MTVHLFIYSYPHKLFLTRIGWINAINRGLPFKIYIHSVGHRYNSSQSPILLTRHTHPHLPFWLYIYSLAIHTLIYPSGCTCPHTYNYWPYWKSSSWYSSQSALLFRSTNDGLNCRSLPASVTTATEEWNINIKQQKYLKYLTLQYALFLYGSVPQPSIEKDDQTGAISFRRRQSPISIQHIEIMQKVSCREAT